MSGRGERANIRLRGDTWHGVWKRDGLHPLRQSLGTKSRQLAEEKWHETQRAFRLGIARKKEITLGDACDLYWTKHVEAQEKLAPRQIKGHEGRAIAFFREGRLMSSIDSDAMIEYRAWLEAKSRDERGLPLKASSVNSRLRYMAAMSRFVASRGFNSPIFSGMTRTLHILRVNKAKLPRTIETPEEMAAVLAAFRTLAPELLTLFTFCQLTMTRVSEACALTWEMVDMNRLIIFSRQKGDRVSDIPLTRKVAALLEGQRGKHKTHIFAYPCGKNFHGLTRNGRRVARDLGEWRPFARGTVHARWDRVRKKAGLRDICWHAATRAKGATDLLEAGVPITTVQRAGRWKTLDMVVRYNRLAADKVREALDAVQGDDGPTEPTVTPRLTVVR